MKVGTSSARRKSQLMAFRPDIQLKELRANVPTRINKLREKMIQFDCCSRCGNDSELDLSDFHVEKLGPRIYSGSRARCIGNTNSSSDKPTCKPLQKLNHTQVANTTVLNGRCWTYSRGDVRCRLEYTEYNDEQEVYQVRASKAKKPGRITGFSIYGLLLSEGNGRTYSRKIGQVKTCRVFITGFKDRIVISSHVLEWNDFQVEGMIETLPVSFPRYSWIVNDIFNIKQAVKYFSDKTKIDAKIERA